MNPTQGYVCVCKCEYVAAKTLKKKSIRQREGVGQDGRRNSACVVRGWQGGNEILRQARGSMRQRHLYVRL